MAKQHPSKSYDRRITKSSSRFLWCFGLINPHKKESIPTVDRFDHVNHVDCDHHKKNNKITVRLPFTRLRVKGNRTSIKTVPVLLDTGPEKPERSEIKTLHYLSKPKSKSKVDQKLTMMISTQKPPNQLSPPTTTNPQPPNEIETVVPTTPDQKPKEKPLENTNLDNRKNSAQSNASKEDTCVKRLSFTRKIDAIRTGSSQPGSPVLSGKTNKPARAFKHSESFPACLNRSKPVTSPKKPAGREKEPAVVGKRFEPLVGLSVVMVTLVIMLMWGRICAILCTSAWLYFVPRLSTAVVDPNIKALGNGSGLIKLDLGSEECKKKVVFEGFLERNNYNNHRGL